MTMKGTNTLNFDPPKRHRDSIYKSVRLGRSIRHNVKKPLKPIFDIESHHEKWQWPVGRKAEEIGISVEDYQAALKSLENYDTVWLGITLLRHEHHFLHRWWANLELAESIAKGKNDAKTLLQVERERQMGIKRLFETARLKYPTNFDRKPEEPKDEPIIIRPLNSENGKAQTSEDED